MLTDLSQFRPSGDELYCSDSRLHTFDPFSDKQQDLSFEDFDETKAERAVRMLCQRVKRDRELQVHFEQHFKSEESLNRLMSEKKFALVLSSVIRLLLDFTMVQEQTAMMKKLKEDSRRLELEKRYCSAAAFEAIIDDVKKANLDLQFGYGRNSEFYERPHLSSELRRKPISARNTVNVSRESLKAKVRTELDSFKFKCLPHYDVERIRKATEEAEKECLNRKSTSRKSKKHEPVVGKSGSSQKGRNPFTTEPKDRPAVKVSDVARISLNSDVNITIPPSLFHPKNTHIERFESFKEDLKESSHLPVPYSTEVPNVHNSEKFIRVEDPQHHFTAIGMSDRIHRTPTQERYTSNNFAFTGTAGLKAQKTQASNLHMLSRPLEVPHYSIRPLKKLSQKKSLQRLQQQVSLQEEPQVSKGGLSHFDGLRSSESLI